VAKSSTTRRDNRSHSPPQNPKARHVAEF
jgi:hypothetical protein